MCKITMFWGPKKKVQKLSYLDNEFLEITRTKQYPERFLLCWLTSSKIWLIPLVDDRSLYNYMIKLNEKHSAACQSARPNFFQ
jgi:hypothetical protein